MATPLHVVVASPQPVPAKGYGGPERVVVALVRGLVALGHRVTLIAPGPTRMPEAAVITVPAREFSEPHRLVPHLPSGCDVLHAHFPLERMDTMPFVQTVHKNL